MSTEQERHNAVEEYLTIWGGHPELVDGLEAHEDRGNLLKRIAELEAKVKQLQTVTPESCSVLEAENQRLKAKLRKYIPQKTLVPPLEKPE